MVDHVLLRCQAMLACALPLNRCGSTRTRLRQAAEKLLRQIGMCEGDKVLDFGCGTGSYTIPAARIVGEQGLVYALDKNAAKLDQLMYQAELADLKNIIRMETHGEVETNFDSTSIDVILLYDVLNCFWFPEQNGRQQLLAELSRILKSRGMLSLLPMHLEAHYSPNFKQVENELIEAGFHFRDKYTRPIVVHNKRIWNGEIFNFSKNR